jgi:hypothetical protein
MAETALREMVERMALQQLAEEQRRIRVRARRTRGRTNPGRGFGVLHAC